MAIQSRPNDSPMSQSTPVENETGRDGHPEGGFFKKENGRYGPIFPRTPACTVF
jgi:hypothetical protein